jgi:hypothetical protein
MYYHNVKVSGLLPDAATGTVSTNTVETKDEAGAPRHAIRVSAIAETPLEHEGEVIDLISISGWGDTPEKAKQALKARLRGILGTKTVPSVRLKEGERQDGTSAWFAEAATEPLALDANVIDAI